EVGAVVEVEGLGELGVLQLLEGLPEGLGAVGGFGLLLDRGVDGAALLGDLGEVADAAAGDQDGGAGFLQAGVDGRAEVAARGRPAPRNIDGPCRSGYSRDIRGTACGVGVLGGSVRGFSRSYRGGE